MQKKMNTYKTIVALLFFTLIFIQCSEDDNNNIIDPPATCEDGIQNGDEEGIDCGGSNCPACDSQGGIDFSGVFLQEDQVGRPAISSVYITLAFRDQYNTTIPSELTALFQQDMENNLLALNPEYNTIDIDNGQFGTNGLGQNSVAFTTMLSRDVLWVAQNGPTTFFDGTQILTGRRLTDDVMDFHLMLLFGGSDFNNPLNDGTNSQPLLIKDGVESNDKKFLPTFPYLAPPF